MDHEYRRRSTVGDRVIWGNNLIHLQGGKVPDIPTQIGRAFPRTWRHSHKRTYKRERTTAYHSLDEGGVGYPPLRSALVALWPDATPATLLTCLDLSFPIHSTMYAGTFQSRQCNKLKKKKRNYVSGASIWNQRQIYRNSENWKVPSVDNNFISFHGTCGMYC